VDGELESLEERDVEMAVGEWPSGSFHFVEEARFR
jgi:hypothetical protein